MPVIAEAIDLVLKAIGTPGEPDALARARTLVGALTARHPLPYPLA
jgi:glycine hydroxymethyltransferase